MNKEILDEFDQEGNPQNVRFAGFWVRVGASIVDSLVMIPIAALSAYNVLEIKSLLLALLLIVIQGIYKPFLEFNYGATLGKMATKIKVVSTNFEPITLNQSILRNGFYLLMFLANMVANFMLFTNPEFLELHDVIGLSEWQAEQSTDYMTLAASMLLFFSVMFVASDLKKQALHDKIAETYCIHNV